MPIWYVVSFKNNITLSKPRVGWNVLQMYCAKNQLDGFLPSAPAQPAPVMVGPEGPHGKCSQPSHRCWVVDPEPYSHRVKCTGECTSLVHFPVHFRTVAVGFGVYDPAAM